MKLHLELQNLNTIGLHSESMIGDNDCCFQNADIKYLKQEFFFNSLKLRFFDFFLNMELL